MGEYLVITADLLAAVDILSVLKNPGFLYWEEGPDHLDVLAKWLPKKGFKLLPKFFDDSYKPGKVGDEGDRLITSVKGCYLGTPGGREDPKPVWRSRILGLSEMREELRSIAEGDVLDMSFEEEVVRVMEEKFGKGQSYHIADERSLEESNFTLKKLGEILLKLIDCMDQVKRNRGISPFFDFYIHE